MVWVLKRTVKMGKSFILEPKANVKTDGQENILQVFAQNAYVIYASA